MKPMLSFWRQSAPLLVSTAAVTFACGGTLSQDPHPGVLFNQQAGTRPETKHSLLQAGDFEDGVMLPWMTSFSAPANGEGTVKQGALCMSIEHGGEQRWDAQLRHRQMKAEHGHAYALAFRAWSSKPTTVAGKFGMSGPPYRDYWTKLIQLKPEPQEFKYHFEMRDPDDATVELAFHAGGALLTQGAPVEVCFDDLVLSDPTFTSQPRAVDAAPPKLRVNQLGYLPGVSKIATLVNGSAKPVAWALVDAHGERLLSGTSQWHGPDRTSGDTVHVIDFTAFDKPGRGYRLQVADATSDAFDVDASLYAKLAHDAFKYFYQNRSGIALKAPFTEGDSWVRAAGHAPDAPTCEADAPCLGVQVNKGWYDAGDYGKYVVNGGIAVWTLLNAYERTMGKGAIPDGAGNIPESGNGVDDLLDEVRWELEFLLSMQVPEGRPLAGMAHHKVHAVEWTALGHAPDAEQGPRTLRPPTTAASLNLAAVSAQAARVFRKVDPGFSARLLEAAVRAWTAANQHPKRFALAADNAGGGAYDDPELGDEFYWAAAELQLTTGKPEYARRVTDSDLDPAIAQHAQAEDLPAMITWRRTDVAAKLSLALLAPEPQRARYRAQLIAAANVVAQHALTEGYRVPHAPTADGRYVWGSNSFILNNMVVLASAYDFSGRDEFRVATLWGMDYLLGRNARGQSYVTGYGERPAEHPHHRFWAHQADARSPKPPPGAVVGGPNSDLQDPYVRAAGRKGCAAQKCYIDHIEAWSQNEVAINWNAPLYWAAAWLDERRTASKSPLQAAKRGN